MSGQTGKYVVRAEDRPRASQLPCVQRPIKRVEFESIFKKQTTSYGKEIRERLFQVRKFGGENIVHAQKTNFPSGCQANTRLYVS